MGKIKESLAEIQLDEYSKSKPEEREESWTTSVNLKQSHRKFLESKNINFSELVRDFLDSLMKRDK